MDRLLPLFLDTCDQHLPPRPGILLAASGGADSQCLIELVGRAKKQRDFGDILVAGVNHSLRPEAESELDLAEARAEAHGLPFERCAVSLPRSGNTLAEARAARYDALHQIRRRAGLGLLATGHTATDQTETVLFNLVRGSGPRGVCGMSPLEGALFRPLLGIPREETHRAARAAGIPFATDPTNHNQDYSRPYLRHTVVPGLTRLNEAAAENINRFSRFLQDDEEYLAELAQDHCRRHQGALKSLPVAPLASLPRPIRSRALLYWCEHNNLVPTCGLLDALNEALVSRVTAWKKSAGTGTTVEISRGHLWCHRPAPPFSEPLSLCGNRRVRLPGFDPIEVVLSPPCSSEAAAPLFSHEKMPWELAFVPKKPNFQLTIRCWQPGDRIKGFGSSGHTTLGNLFTNAKVPGPLRRRWPVVELEGEILWIPGLRRGDSASLTPDTQRWFRLTLTGRLWP